MMPIQAWHIAAFVVLLAATAIPGAIVVSDALFHWSAADAAIDDEELCP